MFAAFALLLVIHKLGLSLNSFPPASPLPAAAQNGGWIVGLSFISVVLWFIYDDPTEEEDWTDANKIAFLGTILMFIVSFLFGAVYYGYQVYLYLISVV